MSVENAEAFIAAVRSSAGLQREVDALQGRHTLARLAEIGAREGYQFSEAEYREAVVNQAGGELSPEALDEVARALGLPENRP